MIRRSVAWTAAACTLTLGLAACGDETAGPVTEAPTPLIEASDGGGESASSDGGGDTDASGGGGDPTAAPDIPAPDPADYPGMDENTAEGAEQATKYFSETLFWGYQSGDSLLLKDMSSSACEACANNIEYIDKLRAVEAFWSPVDIQHEASETTQGEASGSFSIVNDYRVSRHTEEDLESGERTEIPTSIYYVGAVVSWENGRWLVTEMHVEAYGE